MQGNNPPLVQFSPGGEQWWQIPVGAVVYTSDGVPVGTITGIGTTYLSASESMMGAGALHIPLQTISTYDAQTNIVHLSVPSNAVRGMASATPANDPLSLQAMHYDTLPLPTAQPPVTARETTISLREQYLVLETLPNVIKDVTVRREQSSGQVTMTESVRQTSADDDDRSGTGC